MLLNTKLLENNYLVKFEYAAFKLNLTLKVKVNSPPKL